MLLFRRPCWLGGGDRRHRPHHGHIVTCNGAVGSDALLSGDGNHTLEGGAGADDMDGGLGDNLHEDLISSAGDVAAELAAAPTRYTPRSLHSVGNVENLTPTGAAAIDGTGNARPT